MKTLIFFIVVAVSGYYLLSKTDKGSAFLSHYLPQQQIDKASNELLKNVDNRLQEVASKLSHQQQQGLQQLEQRINALSRQLNDLEKQRSITKQQSQHSSENAGENKVVAQQSQTKQHDENALLKEQLADDGEATLAKQRSNNTANERKYLQREKQTSLQFISSRMEQMAIKASSGIY